MPEPLCRVYIHFVWATWDRLPLLTQELQLSVYACIQAECGEMKAEVLALGGIADHVHLLVEMPTTLSVATLMKQIKGSPSHLVTQRLQPGIFFKWQGSYGAFSVSRHELPLIIHYIDRQELHHRDKSLLPEFESTETSPQPK